MLRKLSRFLCFYSFFRWEIGLSVNEEPRDGGPQSSSWLGVHSGRLLPQAETEEQGTSSGLHLHQSTWYLLMFPYIPVCEEQRGEGVKSEQYMWATFHQQTIPQTKTRKLLEQVIAIL